MLRLLETTSNWGEYVLREVNTDQFQGVENDYRFYQNMVKAVIYRFYQNMVKAVRRFYQDVVKAVRCDAASYRGF